MKKEIPIERRIEKPYTFPISNSTIRKVLAKMPEKDLDGIEKILIKSPTQNSEFGKLGTYLDQGIIKIYAQYTTDDGFLLTSRGDLTKRQFKEIVENEVIFHEVGHHNSDNSGEEDAIDYSLKINPNLRKLAKKWAEWDE